MVIRMVEEMRELATPPLLFRSAANSSMVAATSAPSQKNVKGSRDDGTHIFSGARGRWRGSGSRGGHGLRGGEGCFWRDVVFCVLWMCGVRPTVQVAITDQLSWPTIESEDLVSVKPKSFFS